MIGDDNQTLDNPLISVIIPVYNVDEYLDQSLKSVQQQTYKQLQVILVDDGSTDRSPEICEEFKNTDSRFEVYHVKNGGQSTARNIALQKVKGEYITFLDSDDILEKTIFEHLYLLISKFSSDMSMCCPSHFYDKEEPKFVIKNEYGTKTPNEVLLDMFYQRDFIPSVWGKLYKQKLFSNEIRFEENRIFEDVELLPKIIERANKIAFSDSELYGYRHRNKSTTTSTFSDKDLDIIYICNLLEKKYIDLNINKAVLSYSTNCAMRIWLTAPRTEKYKGIISESANKIKATSSDILKDKNVRKKLKIAIILFLYFRPFISFIHAHVNRWK